MAMSTDRVEFKPDTSPVRFSGQQQVDDNATRQAFSKAFGQPMPMLLGMITVRCRPSQFARFLIYREEAGGRNSFKILEAKLVPMPKDTPEVFDYSQKAFSS